MKRHESKYHSIPIAGYSSKKEHQRAVQLMWMQKAGVISDLHRQVRFVLIPPQYGSDNNLIERQVVYIADFVYKDENGETVVEDTKGYRTKEYIIKRKLMLKVHGIRIKET